MARIGIFGGTFNPVHNGHLVMAVETIEKISLDTLLLLPVALPPHKPADELLSADVRLDCLRLATRDLPKVVIDDREVRRGGISYTITTVRELRVEHPADELFFLIGEDSLPDLPKWKEAAELREMLIFAVAGRPGAGIDATVLRAAGYRIELLESTRFGVSSTEIRRRCREGLPLHGFLPESVARELARHQAFRR